MGLTLIVPPTPVIPLAEVKLHLRVDHADEDAMIDGYLAAATGLVESYLGRSLGEQIWRLTLDGFTDAIALPRGPVGSVTSVNYRDVDGLAQVVDPALWEADLISDPQWIVRRSSAVWPVPLSAVNAVWIDYTTGYGVLPAPIRAALLLLTGFLYDSREGGPGMDIDPRSAPGVLLSNFRTYF